MRMRGFMVLVVAIIPVFAGCTQRERKQVVTTEERHEGEVREERPGTMIVE